MHDWTEIETSRRHREDLLREMTARRSVRNFPGFRPRRRIRALLRTAWWELQRDLQRASKLVRAPR